MIILLHIANLRINAYGFGKMIEKKMSSRFERLWNSLQLDHVIHSNYQYIIKVA